MWFLSLLWFLVVYSGLNNSFCERLPILVWDDAGLYHWFYYHQTHWRCSPPIPILLLLERQRCIYMKYWFLVWILLVGPRYAVSESQVTSSRFPLSSNSFSIIWSAKHKIYEYILQRCMKYARVWNALLSHICKLFRKNSLHMSRLQLQQLWKEGMELDYF